MAEPQAAPSHSPVPMWTGWHTLGLLCILVVIVLVGLLLPTGARLGAWLLTLLLLAVCAAVAGQGITGLWRGLLIDERNKISLSRLQIVLWTVVVLSGFLTAALSNLATAQPNPLSIAIPNTLWLLMGISTTSLIASPVIKTTKASQVPNAEEQTRTFALIAKQTGVDTVAGKVANKGHMVVNTRFEDAQWADLFRGEETGNAAHLDLGKVQMFYFTLVLVLA
jgi:hypothetical protein